MTLIPIKEALADNKEFEEDPLCQEILIMTIEFYKRVGFDPPWIGYYVSENGVLVGSAGFKGRPVDNKVEIAYGTFEKFQRQGVGTEICRLLVELSINSDPSIKITARTLPQNNFSTRILEKNGFLCLGIVNDPEDGDVWEWEFQKVKQ